MSPLQTSQAEQKRIAVGDGLYLEWCQANPTPYDSLGAGVQGRGEGRAPERPALAWCGMGSRNSA